MVDEETTHVQEETILSAGKLADREGWPRPGVESAPSKGYSKSFGKGKQKKGKKKR